MGDLIDRQMTVDALDRAAENWNIAEPFNEGIRAGYKAAVTIVLSLPSVQSEQHWILCSRKVPEEKGMYLTTTIDKGVYCDYWNGVNFDRTELVIAWLPLPLPYEGDNDGTNR